MDQLRLRIGPRAAFVVAPGDVTLRRIERRSARRLLLALAERRASRPELPLTVAELAAHGWPDERMRASSAANRVYVAICHLRRNGLRDVLHSDRSGYWLDETIEVVHVDRRAAVREASGDRNVAA